MPCHYQIFPKENLVAKTYFGRVTTKCILKLIDDFEADPDYREGMMEFDDLSGIEVLDISATDISRLADLLICLGIRKQRPARKAVLVSSGPGRVAAFGFFKPAGCNKRVQFDVFDNLSDAGDFLGVSDFARFWRAMRKDLQVT
jgi:hypothetical protein